VEVDIPIMSMKTNTKFVGMTIVTLVLVIAGVFAASTALQALAAAGRFVTSNGDGTLGCPGGTSQPATITFSATDNGKAVSGTFSIALSDGTATGTGDVTKGQIAKNHFVLEGNWNRGGLCGLTNSHSFLVSGIPGHSVLIQFFDICQKCKHNFSGTVIIAPTR